MKVFFISGIVDENLTLAEVKPCEWKKGFASWVYETYPQCYEVIERLGEAEIKCLPGGYSFINFKSGFIGSLPGVRPIYEAKQEKIDIFLDTIKDIKTAKEEKEKREKEEYERWKKERDQRKGQFSIIKTYKMIYPRGGEEGIDGYADLELKHATGYNIRMVARNVFDFGYYVYPKRVEGTDEVFKRENWTNNEKQAEKWLNEFSPFTTDIRM